MAGHEGHPQEIGPQNAVKLGESFKMDLRPVDPKDRLGNYPIFFKEPISIPELCLTGELGFYADGVIRPRHVCPLGSIEFPAELWGPGVSFDRAKEGPLMFSMTLRGNKNVGGRKIVVETDHGVYTAKSTYYRPSVGIESFEHRSLAGGHAWNSLEDYPKGMKIDEKMKKQRMTAYFPPNIGKLNQIKVTIF